MKNPHLVILERWYINERIQWKYALILVISIGFAYLTSNLFINGLIGYRGNSWNIYFDNIQMINNDVDAVKPIINNSKDAIAIRKIHINFFFIFLSPLFTISTTL